MRDVYMRTRRLPKVLRNIVALTLASVGTYACSSGELGEDMTPACPSDDPASPAGFNPGTPVEFLVFRQESVSGAEVNVFERARRGEPCSGATERAACEKRVAEFHVVDASTCKPATEPSGLRSNCDAQYLLATRGDQLIVLKTNEEIAQFLRPIDTKEEAFFLAATKSRLGAACGGGDDPKFTDTGDGFDLLVFDSKNGCQTQDGHVDRVVVHVSSDGDVSEIDREKAHDVGPCSEGRRPCGLRSNGRARKSRSNLGAYFAKASHLEAASVVAFEQLERELGALGAPPRLLRALSKARVDEIRHADVTANLAKRFGATPGAVRVKKGKNRSALAIAIENAREGCVRETLGAVVALYRAERAADPEVARAMRSIAADELRHARLSWELMEWLNERLTPRGRAAVRRAFEREIAALAAELSDPPADVARIAGAPTAATLRSLFDRVASDVWRPMLAAA